MGEQKTFLLFQQATKGESGMSLEDGSMLTKALMKGPAIKNQLDKSNNLLKTREQFSLIEWGNNGRQNQGVKNRANRKLYFGNRLLSKHPFCVTWQTRRNLTKKSNTEGPCHYKSAICLSKRDRFYSKANNLVLKSCHLYQNSIKNCAEDRFQKTENG